ncbi:hypothetical protein FPCIR_4215 [Fusarium pseudocircinatum]|uniref:Uncharacterized protein n=1 Tax=Fusarium pseudocircinatum TaxID=56676 RepID=A0A8H5PG53_9HYPO|nr:hypothetical protein FPCIR_4215 [Fusarium pseudocircinatum]
MTSAQSVDQNVYATTKEGDDFIPKTAKWTCKFGPTVAQCGEINNDITKKKCKRCGAVRSDAVAHVGERLDEGVKGSCWQICEIEDDGTEVWTYGFRRGSMSSTEETAQTYPIETIDQPPEIIPNNATWTCASLPDGAARSLEFECRQRNEGMENEVCSKCGNRRADGSTADLGEMRPGLDEPWPLWMVYVYDDGSEGWTTNFIVD